MNCLGDKWHPGELGLRESASEAKIAKEARDTKLRSMAAAGDSEAQYEYAIDRLSNALREKDVWMLQEAEDNLLKSSRSGNEQAKRYLVMHWEREKQFALRAIAG